MRNPCVWGHAQGSQGCSSQIAIATTERYTAVEDSEIRAAAAYAW
jgi:hypothetical protein